MRIISGALRRRALSVPPGSDVRPTTDRVREAVFNWLTSRVDLEGIRVLDLFAGSGGLGFEALSRGASEVTFVDVSRRVVDHLFAVTRDFGVEDHVSIVRSDALVWLERPPAAPFDIIFADPPYNFQDTDRLPDGIRPHLDTLGYFVLEHPGRGRFDSHPRFVDGRGYGRSNIAYFTLQTERDS